MMKRVAITGGIGCGKSTVVAEFERLGVATFIADRAGAECYTRSSFLSDLRETFGGSIFLSDGQVDKKALAEIVFADKVALERLNALVHPRVMEAFDSFCQSHCHDDYVLFESAIIFEYGLERMMDKVVCVYLDMEERLRRLRLRDRVSDEQLLARMRNQLPAEEVMRLSDYVILNYEGNPRQRQVALVNKLLRR